MRFPIPPLDGEMKENYGSASAKRSGREQKPVEKASKRTWRFREEQTTQDVLNNRGYRNQLHLCNIQCIHVYARYGANV